jgi:hypothetical protein
MDGFPEEVSNVLVLALLTTWLKADEVPVTKLESPPYVAVIEWVPTDSADVVKGALPPASVAVPSVVEPTLKVTVPVGVPEAGPTALTVAVKTTTCPKTDGFADELTDVVVPPWFTVSVRSLAAAEPSASVTWTVKLEVPTVEGAPVI